ncbi:MAG: cytochrome c oxidase subunit 3 [Rhodospirillaceae bacterium]|jgi:cytochrome c oxidase subunit III|nr:cytochrome c oxidase subunit 3 [Rhodospirillaceae bacterium]MBT4219264.1 cytochrome c oxidase subunit 3 [Rhodospirillaceae bacterium]MBT4463543.1 cytochrome c oxidase subunit 3 [Rhodospirillaceae bacterium]MBT5014661.1 cytochrome c oxidase subunit 3 [Rhodospirillaceae bacterium]MBT5308485.1 cytochrome c oxidase subunit 3 [Rhodospirillaceae bacterium]
MSSEQVKKHPFHMVEPSGWPIVGTIGAFVMAVGGIWYMQEGPLYGFLAGLAIVLYCMFGWWRDVVKEAQNGEDHTPVVQHGLRVGMILFIASEVMFFVAFFWAYFHSSVPALSSLAHETWPPEGIVPLHTWSLPFYNTIILLSSGVTLTWAHHALQKGDYSKLRLGLLMTVALGFLFIGLQAYEYSEAMFGITDGIYPSTFYLATGFHGFHVFVGACFLTVNYLRASSGHFTPKQHVGFEAAAWYWHFVDVVWVFLFIWIYWWGSYGYQY